MVSMTRWLAQLTMIFSRDSAFTLNWWDCIGILDLQRVMFTCGAEDWHVRMLLLLGPLVLGLAYVMLWANGRPTASVQSAISDRAPEIGRSALSHGGPGAGRPFDVAGPSKKPLRNLPLNESVEASKR